MAKFGLKKQGRVWGLFHGSETVTDGPGVTPWDAGHRPESPQEKSDSPPDTEQPVYDNDVEYCNVRAAFAEARRQAALESPHEQRERLQGEIEERLTAFESKHRKEMAVHWDAKAEEELHGLMHVLNRLLRHVGLSVYHG